jgi:hypothetical protein
MMFFGLAAFFQITFLPGYLAITALNKKFRVIPALTVSVILSLLINYYLVLTLVLAGWYTRRAFLSVFAAEIILLFYLLSTRAGGSQNKYCIRSFLQSFNSLFLLAKQNKFLLLGQFFALFFLLGFAYIYFSTIGSVFNGWDDVVSWNRWAVDWSEGILPRLTWHYPQVLPASWSISYVFLNNSRIQFFAKATSTIFPILSLLAIFDYWRQSKQNAYLYATSILAILYLLFACEILKRGYADIPVSFMALAAFLLLLGKGGISPYEKRAGNVYLATILCACAALTKQSGIYFAAIFPVFSYLLASQDDKSPMRNRVKTTIYQYVILISLISPWYMYIDYTIRTGSNQSEVLYVTNGIYNNSNLFFRFFDAIKILFKTVPESIRSITGFQVNSSIHLLVAVFLSGCVLLITRSAKEKICRYIIALIVLPYFMAWSLFFSYSSRNLILVFPFIAICVGWGIALIGKRSADSGAGCVDYKHGQTGLMEKGFCKPNVFRRWPALGISILCIALSCYYFTDERLLQRQSYLQSQLGEEGSREILYDLTWSTPDESILTDYQLLPYFSGFGKRAVVIDMENREQFFNSISKYNVKYFCILAESKIPDDYINKHVKDGTYSFIGQSDGLYFVKAGP